MDRGGVTWRTSVDRLACVDVLQLPLQILLRNRPDWVKHPAAVVAEDKPQSPVLFASAVARKNGVLPGQRHAAALGICRELRAAVVAPGEVAAAVAEIERILGDFTPGIERSDDPPGVFWLDASGLSLLEPSLVAWARRMEKALAAARFVARIAVGFRRFATLAAAKVCRGGVIAFDDPAAELRFLREVPVLYLDRSFGPELCAELAKLGVRTVGEFANLPQEGVRARLGPDAERFHRLANDRVLDPFAPAALQEPLERRLAFDDPLTDATSLLFFLQPLLGDLLAALAGRGQALVEFSLHLDLEFGPPHEAVLRPAEPTLHVATLIQLATLHFERSPLEAKAPATGHPRAGAHRPNSIEGLHLAVRGAPARADQLLLFHENRRRDLRAANRALALVRSRFGEGSVGRLAPRDGHLPEARFRFEPLAKLEDARPVPALERTTIRRLFARPIPIESPPRHPRNDDWVPIGSRRGAVTRIDGPYVVSGGWWSREVHREYHFVHALSGDVAWIFYDRARRRWYLHGQVE